MIQTIDTQRFLLRPFRWDDAMNLFELDSDPEVHKYLGNRPLSDISQAEHVIEIILKQYREYGIGRWAVVDKNTGDFFGWSGLKYETQIRSYAYYDLGYRILRKYWGNGIATETAHAALKYGFETLKLGEINAAAHIDNGASNRVLIKLGFKREGVFKFDEELHNWYSIKSGALKK